MSDALEGKVEPPIRGRKAIAKRAAETIATAVGYGGTVTEADFLGLFGITYPKNGSPELFKRLTLSAFSLREATERVLLRAHKMALVSEGHGRWTVVYPHQQAAHARAIAQESVVRGFGKALDVARNTNTENLTDDQRRELTDTAARLAGVRMMAAQGMGMKRLPRLGGKP